MPPRISLAPGSEPLIAVNESRTSLPYSAGFGFATKYLKFSSFQICQVRSGRSGSAGFSAQTAPPGPYLPTASLRKFDQAPAAAPAAGRWLGALTLGSP